MSRRSRTLRSSSSLGRERASGVETPRTPSPRPEDTLDGSSDHGLADSTTHTSRSERRKESSRRFALTQILSTPRRPDDTRDEAAGQSTKLVGKALKKSLGDPLTVGPSWIRTTLAIAGELDDTTVISWLDDESSDSVYWTSPKNPGGPAGWHLLNLNAAVEEELYEGVVSIINAVLAEFVPSTRKLKRCAIDTHSNKFIHKDPEENQTSPDIIVRASGPSFQVPKDNTKRDFGYSNVITFIDVKLDGKLGLNVNIDQLAVYARQVFAYQPNRRFVRGFLLSEKRVKLVQFDRAGTQVTWFIDIHQEPAALVVLIAAVCGINERKIGFDDSIWWKITNGRKVEGTLRTLDANHQEIIYHLEDMEPIAHEYDIRGRAITCWSVRDPNTDVLFVIKDTWSSDDRMSEHLHLLKARGLPGVCQIVAYERREETSDFRCPTTFSLFYNRVAQRVTIEAYGKRIEHFKNILQLFEILRDVVDGHAYLFENDILHRDISSKNILIGQENSPDGKKGILIDLSVALDFSVNGSSTITKEARSGSRFFQSCNILGFLTKVKAGQAPAHDYLDDLEAIFFVLCDILFKKLPDGRDRNLKSKARSVIKDWDKERADDALQPKALLFNPACTTKQMAIELIENSWGQVCKTLFVSYLEWVYRIQVQRTELIQEFRQKQKAARGESEEEEELETDECESNDDEEPAQEATARSRTDDTVDKGVFAPLISNAGLHYDEVLNFFNIAISSLRTEAGLDPGRVPKRHNKEGGTGPVRKSAKHS